MLRPVPHNQVKLTDRFWAPRAAVNRRATLPIEHEQCRKTGRIDAFRLDWRPGRPNEPHIFWDSDVAKWMEAAAYSLADHPDRRLEARLEEVIDLVARAQQPDGYLNVHFTIVEPEKRWTNLRDWHELYCAGHLIEAAVAHFQATGRRKFLAVMCRYADHIAKVFGRGRGQKRGYCGHEEIELALVKLYRATGEKRYLDLAKYFVDERGRRPHYFDREAGKRGDVPAKTAKRSAYSPGDQPYEEWQAHAPVRGQKDAVGHAVRAMYLYSAMADLAAETKDAKLAAACRRLWKSATERRMFITGGVGSARHGERFTFDHDLPNEFAYAETCATIGLAMFAQRMLGLELDGRYGDVMERALYNGIPSGVSLDGRRFFYANPLAVHPEAYRHADQGGHVAPERQEWFGCACCPPNIARLLASVGQYVCSQGPGQVAVHLYAAGETKLDLGGRELRLEQSTDYPWDGRVQIAVRSAEPAAFILALRIPGWCRGAKAWLNGRPLQLARLVRRGYAHIRREWRDGDVVRLDLPMPVERVSAHPAVRHDAGRVALQRGPVVYCLEEADNGRDLNAISLPRSARLTARFDPRLLGGVATITARAERESAAGWENRLYRAAAPKRRAVRIRAVPYSVWANRRPGEMLVWIRADR
ncbi:MAG TPA: glycoside hydrolase family 127 protein [Planctomycetota bacterium]|nr:glycoside hydrolase family 127 protein [Planctomycetota bacterium]